LSADKQKRNDAAKAEAAAEGSPAPEQGTAGSPAEASLAEQVQKLLAEKQDLMNTLVRRQADFENYRKRIEKERHAERHRGAALLIESILPVLDAFDRALAGHDDSAGEEFRKGFELIRRQLWDVLAKNGLKRIESVGVEFNPHLHHAIERVETTEHRDGVVIEEMQTGYMFHDHVLRPAMVRVASSPESRPTPASEKED
jgi:molecular chaperone GrpE